jgi:hypothetical protein
MPSPKQQFPWPDYLPGPSDDLLALGVIALMYGQLESMFQHVFSAVTSLNEIQASAIFQRIPNNVRQDILFQMMAQTTLPDQLKEQVQYFGLGFKTCAANRHAIMHSHSAGVFTSQTRGTCGFLLQKYSKAGNKLVCPASLADLRKAADDTHNFVIYGARIVSDIRCLLAFRDNGDEASFWSASLRHKPSRPTELIWLPEKEVLVDHNQPASEQ